MKYAVILMHKYLFLFLVFSWILQSSLAGVKAIYIEGTAKRHKGACPQLSNVSFSKVHGVGAEI
jgi:hypothetical protein